MAGFSEVPKGDAAGVESFGKTLEASGIDADKLKDGGEAGGVRDAAAVRDAGAVSDAVDARDADAGASAFDPDKLIGGVESALTGAFDVLATAFDKLEHMGEKPGYIEFNDHHDFYTSYEARLDRVPKDPDKGFWSGDLGESKYVPSNPELKALLKTYGLNGIEYHGCEPDFSKVSVVSIKIDGMSEDRLRNNFPQADERCADLWNEQNHDGRSDWTASEVKQWRQDNGYSWHERADCETMDLVPRDINASFTHSGGVAECKARDGKTGGFDD